MFWWEILPTYAAITAEADQNKRSTVGDIYDKYA